MSGSLYEEALGWLLEIDPANPGVRLFALRELVGLPDDDPEVHAAQAAVMETGPVPAILAAQQPEGFWEKPGAGYYPKYTGTVWQVCFLAQLGAAGTDARVRSAGEYVLTHSRAPEGGISMNGARSGLIHCLQGNLAAALLDLEWWGDARLSEALDWLARSITGEGIAPSEQKEAHVRYLRSGNSGPGFLCSANAHLPCAWGAVKAILALSKVPASGRTPAIVDAIDQGVAFLLSRDPAVADYPMGYAEKPSQSWYRFGYPIGYVTDVLQNLETLTALGFGTDERLAEALALILSLRDEKGRWRMTYSYNGKTWADIEQRGKPSKWVTLRALRVLERAGLWTH
jgi:hypothetical protein